MDISFESIGNICIVQYDFFLNAHETRFYLIINLRMHYETGYIIHKCVNSEEWNKCSSVHRLSLPHSPKIPIWY